MARLDECRTGIKDDLFYLTCYAHEKFEHKSKNKLFRIEPSKVVLQLRPDVKPHETVKIINHTLQSQKCFVLPLQNDVFNAKFKNQESIAPGLFLPVEISLNVPSSEVSPNERAWLKIHCFGQENLKVPIVLSEPEVQDDYKVPNTIDFGLVPLCESVSRKIMISSDTKENEIINVTILQPHIDVMVQVFKGDNVNEPACIEVTYCPTSYSTMTMSMMVLTPARYKDFSVVNVTGYCHPPPFIEQLQNISNKKVVFLKQCEKEVKKRNKLYTKLEAEQKPSTQVQKRPLQVAVVPPTAPDKLWWLQKDFAKPLPHPILLGPLGRTEEEDAEHKKVNEEIFQKKVTEIKNRAKNTLLRSDVTNFGMTGNEESPFNYEKDWIEYMKLRTLTCDDTVFKSDQLVAIKQRIIKTPEQAPESKIQKSAPCYSWFTRFHPLCRFIQAGRQVIVMNRLAQRLRLLQQFIAEMQCPVEAEQEPEREEPQKIKFFGSNYPFVPK